MWSSKTSKLKEYLNKSSSSCVVYCVSISLLLFLYYFNFVSLCVSIYNVLSIYVLCTSNCIYGPMHKSAEAMEWGESHKLPVLFFFYLISLKQGLSLWKWSSDCCTQVPKILHSALHGLGYMSGFLFKYWGFKLISLYLWNKGYYPPSHLYTAFAFTLISTSKGKFFFPSQTKKWHSQKWFDVCLEFSNISITFRVKSKFCVMAENG